MVRSENKSVHMKIHNHILLMLISATVLFSGCSKPDGQAEFEKGLRELKRENFVRARALFEKSIAHRPGHTDNAYAHNYLGISAWRLGQFSDAATAFEDSRRLNPNLIEPVYNLGVLAAEREDFREASRYLNEAASMNSKDPLPLEYLAGLHMDNGQWQSARNALYSALDREPQSARIYNSIAAAFIGLDQSNEAIESFMHALEADTKYAPALFNLAVVYDTRKGDIEQARAFYKRFISVAHRDDANVSVARDALRRLEERGTLAAAHENTTPIASHEQVDTQTGESSSVTAEDVTPVQEAVASAGQVKETEFDAALRQAGEKARAGQVQQALDGYIRAAELAAKDRRTDLQENAYREAVRAAIDQPRAHVLLGQHLYDRGKYDQAARSFQQAVTLNADYAPAQLGMARIASRNSEFDAAVIHYRRAISSDPVLADAQWELALVYDKNLELPESAARMYRDFAKNFPGDTRRKTGLTRAEELAPTPKSDPVVVAESVAGRPNLPPDSASTRRIEFNPPAARNTQAAIQAFNRASRYQEEKDWDRAIYFYLRALENDDQLPSAFYNLGICYTMKNDNDLARDAYRRAIRLQPGLVDAKYNLALLYREIKDDTSAVNLLEDITKNRPDYAAAYYALGLIHSEKSSTFSQAKAAYEKYLSLSPNDRAAPAIRQWIESH